jgi:hypothetical protein
MAKNDLLELEDQVCERSDGNPGAINVMCAGIITFGKEFYRRIERANLRGADIWATYKDIHGQDLKVMHDALGDAR